VPIYKQSIQKINDIRESTQAKKFINKKQLHYLRAKDTDRACAFYLLPKIHKPQDKWPQTNMPKGRPIGSDCAASRTELVSI